MSGCFISWVGPIQCETSLSRLLRSSVATAQKTRPPCNVAGCWSDKCSGTNSSASHPDSRQHSALTGKTWGLRGETVRDKKRLFPGVDFSPAQNHSVLKWVLGFAFISLMLPGRASIWLFNTVLQIWLKESTDHDLLKTSPDWSHGDERSLRLLFDPIRRSCSRWPYSEKTSRALTNGATNFETAFYISHLRLLVGKTVQLISRFGGLYHPMRETGWRTERARARRMRPNSSACPTISSTEVGAMISTGTFRQSSSRCRSHFRRCRHHRLL